MTIALFATRWADPIARMTGIGRYMVGLCRGLSDLSAEGTEPTPYEAVGPRERTAPDWLPKTFCYRPIPIGRAPLRLAWATVGWPPLERLRGGFDLLHSLHTTTVIPTSRPSVITVHDVIAIEHPEWYGKTVAWAARRAINHLAETEQIVITVSNHSADRLVAVGGLPLSRIRVIPNGIDDSWQPALTVDEIDVICQSYGLTQGSYFIAVGDVSPRKNLMTLVRALNDLPPDAGGLVACGRCRGDEMALRAAVERSGVGERFRMLGFVPDRALAALISGSIALLQPSMDEGFGLPPLEAMARGTPTIVSRAGSHPEVVGDASILVEALNPEEWANAMWRVATDEDLRETLQRQGWSRAALFTWRRTAEATTAVYEEATAC